MLLTVGVVLYIIGMVHIAVLFVPGEIGDYYHGYSAKQVITISFWIGTLALLIHFNGG